MCVDISVNTPRLRFKTLWTHVGDKPKRDKYMPYRIGVLPPFTGDKIRLNLSVGYEFIIPNLHVEVIAVRFESGSYQSTDLLLKLIESEGKVWWCKRTDILTYTLLN
jgi:hypothetical protein